MNIELNDIETRILKHTINIALRSREKVYNKKMLEDDLSELTRGILTKQHEEVVDNLNSVLEKLQ